MKITTNEVNKEVTYVSAKASAFIVPNPACPIKRCLDQSGLIRRMQDICDLNGVEFNEDDRLIEMWFHSKELNTDNLIDHGGFLEDSDGNVRHIYVQGVYMPESIIKDCKEGDVITYKMRGFISDPREELILELELTLQQKEYRYSRFGNIEEVLEFLLNQ